MNQETYDHHNQPRMDKKTLLEACTGNHCAITGKRLSTVEEEFFAGINFIESYDKSVTIFGSARFKEGNKSYDTCRSLAKAIVEKTGYAIASGGGPGIMEAANRGAFEAGGDSIAFTINLPFEQTTNPYATKEVNFHYFFTRKVALTYSAEAYVYCPGGFGTMDELFEILTLIQTKKIPKVPIILYGSEFWNELDGFIKKTLLQTYETISPEDIDLYEITDDIDYIVSVIEKAPVRNGA